MSCNVALVFDSENEFLKCDRSNGQRWSVTVCCTE